jgi:hypothetical protein
MEDPKTTGGLSLGSDTLNPKKHELWHVPSSGRRDKIHKKLNQHNKTNLRRKLPDILEVVKSVFENFIFLSPKQPKKKKNNNHDGIG